MRLLHGDTDGSFHLLPPTDDPPPYAILSHTWGRDEDEVTYDDIIGNTGTDKTGYKKIEFCARQAKQDGIDFFWVDTCCIKKSDLSELSEAINSMFRWYQNSERCYVYLSGLSETLSSAGWESSFRSNRWFTRGWTLQELVAPRWVYFFNESGHPLGDKRKLETVLHEITGISRLALQGRPLVNFGAEEPFKWAERRQTKKEEDWAYSLIGIFNVSMRITYGEGRELAVQRLRNKISRAAAQARDGVAPPRPAVWLVPFERNPSFTGREVELLELYEKLWVGDYTSRVAVTGLGGVGKTHLVLELLHRRKTELRDCSVIWIPATSKESLQRGYLNAAKELKIAGYDAKDAQVNELVQSHLSRDDAGQWLLIFDNADDIGMWTAKTPTESGRLLDLLPMNRHGSIIFTTRNGKAAVKFARQNYVNLPSMGQAKSIELLGRYLADKSIIKSQRRAAEALVVQLAHLPLAIVQASMYINANKIGLVDYLNLMEDQEQGATDLLSEEFEDNGRYPDIKNPVATTWLISFINIRRENRLAAKYLAFMSCVDSKDIPLSMLPSGPSLKEKSDAIGCLDAYSFVTRHVDSQAVTLHRLVHWATRSWLKKEGQLLDSVRIAVATLATLLYDVDQVNRAPWRSYMPHAAYILDSGGLQLDDAEAPTQGKDSDSIGHGGSSMARRGPSEKKARQTGSRRHRFLTTLSRIFNDKQQSLAVRISSASHIHHNSESGAVQDEYNDEYPDDIRLLGRYGYCLRLDARYREAEAQYQKLIRIEEMRFGAHHQFTLRSMSQLALTMWGQGRLAEAEDMGQRVLKIQEGKLGESHEETLTTMNNLAITYHHQGRHDEAEELQVQVLEARKIRLGKDHPDTLTSMNNLASTYWQQGRHDEAEELMQKCARLRVHKLGASHPDVKASLGWLDQWRIEDEVPTVAVEAEN